MFRVAPGASVLGPRESAHPRHDSNDPPIEAGAPVAKHDSCLLASEVVESVVNDVLGFAYDLLEM